MIKLEKDVNTIINNIKKITNSSGDIVYKKVMLFKNKNIYIVYSQSLSESDKINDFILKSITIDVKYRRNLAFKDLLEKFKSTIPSASMRTIKDYNDLFFFLYNGFCLVIIDGYDEIITFETKAKLDRGIQQATNEPIVHGPKDSFTEDFYKNIGLIRKRIRSEQLWLEEFIIGKKSKTRVGLVYIENVVEKELVQNIKQSLEGIDVDGIVDVTQIKELIFKDAKTTFPVGYYTERPDLVSIHLLKGKLAIIIDNSPVAIIIPTFFIDFFHTSDDYYQKPIHVTISRLIRILAFFFAVMVPGYYIALVSFERGIIPPNLLVNIIAQRSVVPFPIFIELLILALTFEILRESDIRSPINAGGSISILGALILGQAAVAAGLVSTIAVIIIAIAAMSSLVFQSKEFSNALRLWRFIFIGAATLFGTTGVFICGLLLTINLCSIKSFGKPFLIPFSPFIKSAHKDAIYRMTIANDFKRNPILVSNDTTKQRGGH